MPPILASDLLPALLQTLAPDDNSQKLVIATLTSLNNLASSCASLAFTSPDASHEPFAQQILSRPAISAFISILRQQQTQQANKAAAQSLVVQQQISLTADLIANCCFSDTAKDLMVKEGLLDALANILATFAASYTTPRPQQLPPSTLRNVLNALSAIIEGSNYRSYRLMYSPALTRLLTTDKDRSTFDQSSAPNFTNSGLDFQAASRPTQVVSVENLLPKIMVQKSVSYAPHAFPTLTLANSRPPADPSVIDSSSPSPLCLWLIHLSRSQSTPSCRLAALRLLALVSNALDAAETSTPRSEPVPAFKERERQLALLAVPIAVKLVKDAADPLYAQALNPAEAVLVKSEACGVLARLLKNNVELQRAAHTADAHKYIAKILRRSFDPATFARPMWSPQYQNTDLQSPSSPSTTMGNGGLPQEIVYAMKCRAGALEAVAAISEREDTMRKDLIEAGVASHIIDSLTPLPQVEGSNNAVPSPKDGNTTAVILAACQAATAMSRSVGNLRTSLIDAGLGKPIFALLNHSDNAVQIAATDVSINLVLDFSPMREVSFVSVVPRIAVLISPLKDLINAGVIQIFCMHAKRSSPKLRQVSLWGLKHLVLNAPQTIKRVCLEELGSGWLIKAISGEDSPSGTSLGLSSANAQGERVDLLNAPNSPDMDLDMTQNGESDDEDGEVSYDQNGTLYQSSGIRSTLEFTSNKSRLRMFHEQEFNPAYQAKRDDILIQEQALDFLRNLINGDDNIPMIDHVNNIIGASRIFDMLYNKLKPVVAPSAPMHGLPLTQRQYPLPQPQATGQAPNSPCWQPPELIHAALGVLVHLAAGSPKHRQQLVAQKQLLKAWLPHFNHPDRQIRVQSVWGVINLTWPETLSDKEDARRRATELRAIGIEERVRSLVNDADLDTKERVKTALAQIDELLEGVRHR